MKHEDICTMAQALARNCGFAVFPCGDDKRPTRPCPKGEEGEHGFKDASKDPDEIGWLWRNWPGPLIGVATGKVSNRIVLDLDVEHDTARAWWHIFGRSLLPTTVLRTRRGGIHLHFLATAEVGSITHGNKRTGAPPDPLRGVDVRGEGGFAIFWFAAGLPMLNSAPPAPWPDWLSKALFPPPAPPPPRPKVTGDPRRYSEAGIGAILRKIAETPEGNRNAMLNWGAWCLGRRVVEGELGRLEAETLLANAARDAGFVSAADIKASARTIQSGLKAAGA
jgi:hypothetical protein